MTSIDIWHIGWVSYENNQEKWFGIYLRMIWVHRIRMCNNSISTKISSIEKKKMEIILVHRIGNQQKWWSRTNPCGMILSHLTNEPFYYIAWDGLQFTNTIRLPQIIGGFTGLPQVSASESGKTRRFSALHFHGISPCLILHDSIGIVPCLIAKG